MKRRRLSALSIAFILVTLTAYQNAHATVLGIDRISTTVSNLDRSVHFYEAALGFSLLRYEDRSGADYSRLVGIADAHARVAVMKLGEDEVELVQYRQHGRRIPGDSKSPDLWFQHFAIIVSDMDRAYTRLESQHPRPISRGGPQQLPASSGGVKAFKFLDPDGHPLELLYFPPGAGRSIWHTIDPTRIFLGIDHSAIGVSDTDTSRTFYLDMLGLELAYESVNQGSSQEQLDGTLGAVVRISGVRAGPEGVGIEFLDYRTPPTGRPAPVDEMTNDIGHMHLVLRVDLLDQLAARLSEHKVRFVSPRPEPIGDGLRGLLVRDPDRHEVLLIGN